MTIEGNAVFMVVITVCTISGCYKIATDVHMKGGVDRCVRAMSVTAKTLHIERPDLSIADVKCIPVEET